MPTVHGAQRAPAPRTSRALRLALAAVPALACAAAPARAEAHGLVGRTDLPMPPWLFAWAAACVLVLSFTGLAILWPRPRLERTAQRPLFTVPRWLEPACGTIAIAVFALVVVCGLAGSPDPLVNLAPTFVWVLFWVGLAFASALLGDVFRPLNPWRAAARAAAWAARGAGIHRRPRPYPRRLGYWPAAAGLLAFAWCELAFVSRDEPAILAWLILAYATAQLAGMWRYGIEPWSARGDAFAVYFSLLARLAPLGARHRQIILRWPLVATTRLELAPGLLAVLTVMLGSTAFDGFSNGAVFKQLAPHGVDGLTAVGVGPTLAAEIVYGAALLACIALVAGIYRMGVAGMRTIELQRRTDLGARFAHSLLPIALAYVVAHYFSLLVYQGQATLALASDPLGDGANLFGTATWGIDYGVISPAGIWYVQVAALVAGHVSGLVLAHDRALLLWPKARAAVRSQYWMLTVMVAYTSLGLWILSAVGT